MRAGTERIAETYLAHGSGPAWAEFMRVADLTMPEGDQPSPAAEPTEPDPQAVADERHLFLHELRSTTRFEPDLDALRAGSPRIVVGIGEASAGELCDRTSRALATALAVEPTMFPGGHIGLLEAPVAFEARLREMLG